MDRNHHTATAEDVVSLCGTLLDSAADVDRFGRFLEQFCPMLGSEKATLGVYDYAVEDITFYSDIGLPPSIYPDYEPFIYSDPRMWNNFGPGKVHSWPDWIDADTIARMKAGEFYVGEKLIGERALRDHGIYREFLQKYGLITTLGGYRFLDTHQIASIMVCRDNTAPSFDRDDERLVSLAAPVIYGAMDLYCRLHQLEQQAALAKRAMDSLGVGLALLDRDARVVFSNQGFDALVASEPDVSLVRGQLRCRDEDTQGRLQHEVNAALDRAASADHDFGRPLRIPRDGGGVALTALIATLNPRRDNAFFATHIRPYALLVVSDPDRALEVAPPKLMALFGITRAEARVLALLVAGLELKALAARLRLADSTVRSHIKSLLGKLGVRRQTELIRLVLNSPLAALSEALVKNEQAAHAALAEVANEGGLSD